MRIQNNIMAMNTHRQLGINNLNQSKSTEKLSSGFRINRAADDAAGLSISEKMRAQIRGLNMASANAQDGISLVQAAEGALQESHSILQRMRELAVKAANDVNESEDRDAIKAELDQLTAEIDRIASTTEFNKKTLLDGSLSNGLYAKAGTNNISGATVLPGTTATTGIVTESVTSAATAYATTGITAGTANASAAGSITLTGGALGTDSITVNYLSGATVASIDADIATALQAKLGTDYIVTNTGAGVDVTSRATGLTAAGSISISGATTGLTAAAAGSTTQGAYAAVSGGYNTTDGVTYTNATFGVSFNLLDDTVGTGNITFNIQQGSTLTLQVGANTGRDQTIGINIDQLNAYGLGISGLNVSDHANAQNAIDAIENAIQHVSNQRSSLGAVQNRLEHTVANLDTVSENLTSAESRIRDVDMAKEMMNFTKNNILSQAATAMLAQANQAPQTVLQLLR